MLRLKRLKEYLGESLWFVPALLILAFVVLAMAAAYVDRNLISSSNAFLIYGGSAEGARTILATIATAMLSLAVLVFSITLVVLQLASSQLTPRVMSLFLQDRSSKSAMGVFLGTFVYAVTGLWFVRTPSGVNEEFVPVLTVSIAFLAVGLSLLTFLNYIHRVAQSIRLETIAAEITRQILESIEADSGLGSRDTEREPSVAADASRVAEALRTRPTTTVAAPHSGLFVGISIDVCSEWARENDTFVEVLVPLGEFAAEGTPLIRMVSTADDAEFPFGDIVSLGSHRTIALDPAYGVRELVDIAVRALSPGVNEPGMAVVVLDGIHEVLDRVGRSRISGAVSCDSQGEPRVIVPRLTWAGWVSLGLREVLDYGGDSVQVCRRVTRMLEDLLHSLPTDRNEVLQRYVDEVRRLPGSGRPYMERTGTVAGAGD